MTSNAIQSNEIFDMAEERGISKRTLENAKKGAWHSCEKDKQFLVLGIG